MSVSEKVVKKKDEPFYKTSGSPLHDGRTRSQDVPTITVEFTMCSTSKSGDGLGPTEAAW